MTAKSKKPPMPKAGKSGTPPMALSPPGGMTGAPPMGAPTQAPMPMPKPVSKAKGEKNQPGKGMPIKKKK